MIIQNTLKNRIPISVSLAPTVGKDNLKNPIPYNKKRLLTISALAIFIAIMISFIAKFLIHLIDLITNIAFHGEFSWVPATPLGNNLGYFVIAVPVLGGIIIGLMALYGSKAIRGHGIPEAMEQILTNQSKIKPSITYLKPLSSAISIGTGGPFGAEGPIIATGGALGSTLGQLLKISDVERKILLAAGATAGMSAIFGTPIAAIFLAIELLLFEFSPRSLIPVTLACITGSAGHHFLFHTGPVFPIDHTIEIANNPALFVYSIMGILIGLISIFVTKFVYFVEDGFEKLPIHWMWWPAIGGIGVGIIGYFYPETMGVGYENITQLLSGNTAFSVVIALCFFKFISWAIALGSGTSGGTLAPLLTIGGGVGILLGSVAIYYFPNIGISYSLAALVGMSALFAGASRALLTSIIFALETTYQSNALLPLLAACSGSYFVSYFLMENTIMTEKIARRGIVTPNSYEPDILENYTIEDVLKPEGIVFSEENTIEELRTWVSEQDNYHINYYIISSNDGEFKGIISSSNLFNTHHDVTLLIGNLIKRKNSAIAINQSLKSAIEKMATENIDVLPVVAQENNNKIVGILSYQDIISVYKLAAESNKKMDPSISLKRKSYKLILRGRNLMSKK